MCSLYGKATCTNANKLRYDIFSQKYLGTSDQALNAFDGIYFRLVSFSLSPPCMFKEPVIRHAYLFLDVQSHAWHNWKVADGDLSILSGLMVELYNMN